MKKIISLGLVLLMCLTTLIACGGTTDEPETTTPGENVTTPSAGDDVTTDAVVTGDVTVGNLQGETIKILAWGDAENLEFEHDDTKADQATISDAILQRNTNVTTHLNAVLEFIYTPGNYNNQQAYVTKAESFANGDEGEFVDILASYSMTTALASTKGLCANLMQYEKKDGGLNFDHPWWPQTLVKEAMFDGMLFVCTGDISTNLLWMMETMYFSKDLLIDLKGESAPKELYKLAEDGKWTIAKFYEYCTDVYSDLNTDGKKSAGDQVGYICTWDGYFDDFYVGAGFNMCERDSSGKLIISPEWGGEREDNFVKGLVDFTFTNDFLYATDATAKEMFPTGKALFHNNRAKYAKTARETAEIEYGILPMPKYDEAQENYSTCLGFPHTLYAISSTSTQPENAALVLESMAANGYTKITPVLFEDALKLRYSPELEDAMMFDILRDSTCFDVGRIYCTPLDNNSWDIFRSSIAKGSTSYVTKIKAAMKASQTLVDALVADLTKAGNMK